MNEKVRIESVTKMRPSNESQVTILSDISASVANGDIYTIIGPSGSGKSTLLRLINRLDDPTKGKIRLDGQDISTLNILNLRRQVGMVFQRPVAFEGTVEQNLLYGAKLAGLKIDPADLIRRVGLSDSFLTREAASLSGGELQRLSIARTLATNPDTLLMDEPTSALDLAARNQIEELVMKMNREEGLTILFVTHDMQQAKRIGTRTLLLVNGKNVEESDTESFFKNPQSEISKLFLRGELKA